MPREVLGDTSAGWCHLEYHHHSTSRAPRGIPGTGRVGYCSRSKTMGNEWSRHHSTSVLCRGYCLSTGDLMGKQGRISPAIFPPHLSDPFFTLCNSFSSSPQPAPSCSLLPFALSCMSPGLQALPRDQTPALPACLFPQQDM